MVWKYLHKNKKQVLFASASFLILFASFLGNIFGLGPSQGWFSSFQKDSSLIVEKATECYGKFPSYSGPLIVQPGNDYTKVMSSPGCSPAVYKPYASQYGLQSRVVAFFAPDDMNRLNNYFVGVNVFLAAMMALTFTLFISRIRKEFSLTIAAVVLSLVTLSPWIAAYSQNMYWAAFLMFAPFIFGFITYPWFKQKGLLWVFYSLVGVLLTVKLLNGYEHITTLMISCLIPIIFYETMRFNKRKPKEFLRPAFIVFAVSCISFFMAILANTSSLTAYYGSWPKSFQLVTARAEDRAVGLKTVQPDVVSGFKTTLPDLYLFIDRFYDLDPMLDGKSHPIKYAALSVVNYVLLPAVSLPFLIREPIGTILQSIGVLALVAFAALYWMSKKQYIEKQKLLALRYSYWLGLVGALSWLILMPGHAYAHAHLNAIVFYIPFLLICYIIIGITLQTYLRKKVRHGK